MVCHTFGDLDGDGVQDIVGDSNGTLYYFKTNASTGEPPQFELENVNFLAIDINQYASHFVDERRWLVQFGIGRVDGTGYAQNNGTTTVPIFDILQTILETYQSLILMDHTDSANHLYKENGETSFGRK